MLNCYKVCQLTRETCFVWEPLNTAGSESLMDLTTSPGGGLCRGGECGPGRGWLAAVPLRFHVKVPLAKPNAEEITRADQKALWQLAHNFPLRHEDTPQKWLHSTVGYDYQLPTPPIPAIQWQLQLQWS